MYVKIPAWFQMHSDIQKYYLIALSYKDTSSLQIGWPYKNRVHEIAYGFSDPSEKNVSPH
jgi:hypothetical protein